jgi:glycosyltransferase involved in cell wall biosynthesis
MKSPHIGINAHLLSGQSGYRRAGIHTYIYHLLEHLPAASHGWRYTVMVGAGTPPEHAALTVRRSRMDTSSPMRRIAWEQALQPFQPGDFDLVHQMAFVAPLIMPHPFVVTVYDLTFVRYPERLPTARRLYLRLFTRLSCQRARRVIAISQSTADDLHHLLGTPREKIDVAVPGIDPRFRPLSDADSRAFRQRHGLPDRFLLCVCTLEPRKNLSVLLHAYAALPPADRDAVHLVLAGGQGWMYEALDALIEGHRLRDHVHLPGFIPDDALAGWYNAAETFVYPSVFEGWGMPVTEAMACGKPVIVSNVSSLPEAAGETGLRVAPHDVAAWTEALRRAIHDPVWRADAGAQALARSSLFTWLRTATSTVASYRRALRLD